MIVNPMMVGGGGDNESIIADIIGRTISTSVNDADTTSIRSYAFYQCLSLNAVSFPNAISIGEYAFYSCASLISALFSKATTIGASAFISCKSLKTISFPNVITINQAAFRDCSMISLASFSRAGVVKSNAFTRCYELTTAIFPEVTSIEGYAFYNCHNLISVYLMNSTVASLSQSAFDSTPIVGYSASTSALGSIYVPASLLTSYQTAANWSLISSRIVGV